MREPIGQRARALVLGALALGALTFTVACGVPISAENLDLTPTVEPTRFEAAFIVSASDIPTATQTPAPVGTPGTPEATGTAAPTVTGTPPVAQTPVATPAVTATIQVLLATPVPPSSGDPAADALKLLNDYRTGHGLSALAFNANLKTAANAYARLMADNSWFVYSRDPHDGPDGSSPASRVAASGYSGRFRGEALAGGQTSAQSAITTWLTSPAHAAILLDPSAVDVAIGYYFKAGDTYGHYWVLETGIP